MSTEFELLIEAYIQETISISKISALQQQFDRHKFLLDGLEIELHENLSALNHNGRIEYLERLLQKVGKIFPLGQISSTTRNNLKYFGHNKGKIIESQDAQDNAQLLTLLDPEHDKNNVDLINNKLDEYYSQGHVFRKWKLPDLFNEKKESDELIIDLKTSNLFNAFRAFLADIDQSENDINHNLKTYFDRFLIVDYKFSKTQFILSVASILVLLIDKLRDYEVPLVEVFKDRQDLEKILRRLIETGVIDAKIKWLGIVVPPLGKIEYKTSILALVECLKRKNYLKTTNHKNAVRAFFNHLNVRYHESTLSSRPKDFEIYIKHFDSIIPSRTAL